MDYRMEFHEAPCEADVEIARLIARSDTNVKSAAISKDSDLFCGYTAIHTVIVPSRSPNHYGIVRRDVCINKTGLRSESLQVWATVSGNDYCTNIPSLGSVRNLEALLYA